MEIWKPIARFGNVIEASNLGKVRRVDSMVFCRNGHKRLAKARVFKSRKHPWGYEWFEFSVEGKVYRDFGHRLVMEAFVGRCPDGHYVLHRDNNPKNNCLENLRYGTPKENCADKLMHGTQKTGEQVSWHKLKEAQIVDIRCRRADGEKLSDIAGDYEVSEVYVWQICTGKKWPNAGGPIEPKIRNLNVLNEQQKAEAMKLRDDGWAIGKLAKLFKTSNTQMHSVVRKHEDKKCKTA